MEVLPRQLFDIYALSLPRGLGFGCRPPVELWTNRLQTSCGCVTRDLSSGEYGYLAMTRRADQTWEVDLHKNTSKRIEVVRSQLENIIDGEIAIKSMPSGTKARASLADLGDRSPNDLFKLLGDTSHAGATWLINQIYVALPNPDKNWASDFQTANFHTRLWELVLLACLREQGCLVTQPYVSPDFKIENREGQEAWVEAVTSNPKNPYNHINNHPSSPPSDLKSRCAGEAAVRFAKTIGSKLQRKYHDFPHVKGKPFALAIADFHAPSSMVWTREALMTYIYGSYGQAQVVDGILKACSTPVSTLEGPSKFKAGLFRDDSCANLSAVVFSNGATLAKFNRVFVSAGGPNRGYRYTRIGDLYDRTPNSLKGIPFCLDVTSNEYRKLWPQGYEPWSAELEIFHNPYAHHPFPTTLLPEATHWVSGRNGITCRSHYEHSILHSITLTQKITDPIPRYEDFLNR